MNTEAAQRVIVVLLPSLKSMLRRSLSVALVLLPLSLPAAQAPDFTLPGVNNPVQLSDYRGDVMYVDFWASWCTPCRKSFPWMNDLQTRYADRGLKVVAINLDARRSDALEFLAEMPARFDVAFDVKGTVASDWEVKGMPSSYIVDRTGRIVFAHIGFRSRDKARIEARIVDVLDKARIAELSSEQ